MRSRRRGHSENLWSDELGRIKVQFPWDRLGAKDQHSSCWLRVKNAASHVKMGPDSLPLSPVNFAACAMQETAAATEGAGSVSR